MHKNILAVVPASASAKGQDAPFLTEHHFEGTRPSPELEGARGFRDALAGTLHGAPSEAPGVSRWRAVSSGASATYLIGRSRGPTGEDRVLG